MPKPSDYTPARRRIMQGVMLLILGGAIAVAAAVTTSRKRANRVVLSPETFAAKDVTVRLPQGWRPRSGSNDPAVVVQAIEDAAPDADIDAEEDVVAATRTVTVRVESMPWPMSSLQYLFANHDLPIAGPRQREIPENWLMSISIAGRSGVMMTAERGSRRRGATQRKEVVATVALPSQRAITVHLEGLGEADARDQAVVKQVAAAITLAGEPELGKPGDIVTLVDGIRFTAPRRFAPVPSSDPNVADRLLWPAATSMKKRGADDDEDLEDPWRAIETVGCLCPDFDPGDPKQAERAKSTLMTLLLMRETLWRGATITSLGNRAWRADPVRRENGSESATIPARAYLKTDPSGRALLVIVYCGFDAADFDGAWREVEPTIQFLPAADIASLEDVGTSEASRLRRAGYEKLLADRDIEWWLWTRQDAYIGWSSTDFPGAGLAGKTQKHIRLSHGDVISHAIENFSYQDAGPQYSSTVTRDQVGPGANVKTVQQTTLKGGLLSMSYQHAERPTTQPWNGEPAPPQFVPGALLPLLIGQLSRDPMLLLTDTFPSREGIAPPQPLAVIIRPGDNTTRTAQGDATPLRCVTVQINGSGEISRWYFRKTGELETVEWPRGLKQIASDQNVVKNNFPKDSGMSP